MYVAYFGLKRPPFSIAPDPRYLFMSERHREALAHLVYGVGGGGGFVLLSGEIGAGKTTVCRCFLEQVPVGCQVAYIFNPKLTVIELLQSICDEFAIAVPQRPAGVGAATVKTYIDLLNRHLLTAHAQRRQCVLIIDEAQNLSAEVLEQLRLLTNLETNERKLLQIILIGQPELRSMLAGPGLEQLAQRVIARYHLGALSGPETAAYVAHRLAVAGLAGPLPFDAAALRRLYERSAGVPRRINLLADRALLGAYAQGLHKVGRQVVEQAAREVFDRGAARAAAGRRPLASALAAGVAAVLVLAVAFGLSLSARRGPVGKLAPAAAAASIPASTTAPSSVAAARSGSAAAAATPVAGGAAPIGGPAEPVPIDADQGLAVFPRDEQQAWRELAALWGLAMPQGAEVDACQSVRTRQLRCWRSANTTLAQVRQLDRPGLLLLHTADGALRYAQLVGLGAQQARLASGAQRFSLPLDELARLWRGEFATLWRAPDGYGVALEPGARGPTVDALAQALAALRQQAAPAPGQVLAGPLAARLAGFQLAQGLRPDGIAGPTTFMQLNRARGVAEPRLIASPPER